jgi:hypothetical protein
LPAQKICAKGEKNVGEVLVDHSSKRRKKQCSYLMMETDEFAETLFPSVFWEGEIPENERSPKTQ